MTITDIKMNMLNSDAPIICQQVNCKGVMGAGLAKQIRNRYPDIYDYYRHAYTGNHLKLGNVLFFDTLNDNNQIIANLCGQDGYGRGMRYTDYDALKTCLNTVKTYATTNNIDRIGIPYGMSCGLAGGNWDVVTNIIKDVFKDTNITIEIYSLL